MRTLLLMFFISMHLFSNTLEFSDEESLWIDKNMPIIYVGDPDWLPFEAFDKEGNYEGIVADLLKTIEQQSPLKFKIIKTSSWQESVDIMKSNKAMLVSQSKVFKKQTTHV